MCHFEDADSMLRKLKCDMKEAGMKFDTLLKLVRVDNNGYKLAASVNQLSTSERAKLHGTAAVLGVQETAAPNR